MTTPDITPDRPAVKAVITGLGNYETRDKRVVKIVGQNNRGAFSWIDGNGYAYTSEGCYLSRDRPSARDIVARVDAPAEPAKQEFRITGPGRYKDAGGKFATIEYKLEDELFPWRGIDSKGRQSAWRENGSWLADDGEYSLSIVAGPFPDDATPQADAKELAGLTGYGVFKKGLCTFIPPYSESALREALETGTVIDLSTITKDQLVQPKPEPKRVKQWLNIYRNNSSSIWDSREEADRIATPNRIACIEVEFTEGEGLGDVS